MSTFEDDLNSAMGAVKDKPLAQKARRCILPPVGCGKDIIGFNDGLSMKEYQISGLCQACQDVAFAEEEE